MSLGASSFFFFFFSREEENGDTERAFGELEVGGVASYGGEMSFLKI